MTLVAPRDSVADGANQIRQIVTRVSRQATSALNQINRLIAVHTRAALLVEFGDDAQDLRDFYTDVKALALKYTGVEVDDMATDPEPE
jgi:hypothetical protein